MSTLPFTMILCEGYHDRAFLAGACVTRLGWREPPLDEKGNRVSMRDAWGTVSGGDFGFEHGVSKAQLRIRPVHGHMKMNAAIERVLKVGKPFNRIVVCYDGDKGGAGADFLDNIHRSIEGVLTKLGRNSKTIGAGHWRIDDTTTEVRALVWHCNDTPCNELPDQQCLERVICASVRAVWPARTGSLTQWLRDRPEPTTCFSGSSDSPSTIAKSHAWAVMAGWFAEHGCDDFHRILWHHDELNQALRQRLEQSGNWAVLEACASFPLP